MMLQRIIPRERGKFIHRYDLVYQLEDGQEKVYEIISRREDLTTPEDLRGRDVDAVVIIATDASGDRILLNREFRMAVGEPVFSFPAGLMEPGETFEEAAARELWEETGLELYAVEDQIGVSYSAVSFGNERNVCIVGRARGTIRPSTLPAEEIQGGWYGREEVRKLLQTELFAARTQAYLYVWSRQT